MQTIGEDFAGGFTVYLKCLFVLTHFPHFEHSIETQTVRNCARCLKQNCLIELREQRVGLPINRYLHGHVFLPENCACANHIFWAHLLERFLDTASHRISMENCMWALLGTHRTFSKREIPYITYKNRRCWKRYLTRTCNRNREADFRPVRIKTR